MRIEIFINIIRQNYKHSGKKKKIRKMKIIIIIIIIIIKIIIIVLTKNNNIYNTGIVTSNGRAI